MRIFDKIEYIIHEDMKIRGLLLISFQPLLNYTFLPFVFVDVDN